MTITKDANNSSVQRNPWINLDYEQISPKFWPASCVQNIRTGLYPLQTLSADYRTSTGGVPTVSVRLAVQVNTWRNKVKLVKTRLEDISRVISKYLEKKVLTHFTSSSAHSHQQGIIFLRSCPLYIDKIKSISIFQDCFWYFLRFPNISPMILNNNLKNTMNLLFQNWPCEECGKIFVNR